LRKEPNCMNKNSVTSAEQIKNKEKGQERETQSILYWFTLPQGLRPVFFASLAKKVPLHQSIVQLQLIK